LAGRQVALTAKTLRSVALDDSKDVVVLFHAKGCEPCAHMTVYFKRVAQRFHELGHTKEDGSGALVVARMDVTDEAPPADLQFQIASLPALVILPAKDKAPPYRYFSGVAKVLEMMKWVESEASGRLNLPPLAHLRDEDKDEYRRQVAEREASLAPKRTASAAAAAAASAAAAAKGVGRQTEWGQAGDKGDEAEASLLDDAVSPVLAMKPARELGGKKTTTKTRTPSKKKQDQKRKAAQVKAEL